MENIKDGASWSGSNPLTLQVRGTGKYVMDFLCNAVQKFEDAEYEREQSIRSDYDDNYR
jgi:hypothetical protein